jgi:hypothetical protein
VIYRILNHTRNRINDYVYCDRASFELEPGAAGQRTDFKESNKMLEWNLKKASVKSLTWFASLGIY